MGYIKDGNTLRPVSLSVVYTRGGNYQSKNVSPSTSQQIIVADNNYDALSQVVVEGVTHTIDANIVASNIKSGVNILGVEGTYTASISLQAKTITPTTSSQVVTYDVGYNGLSQVTVSAVDASIDANIVASNIKSGVSILGVQGTCSGDDVLAKRLDTSLGYYTYTSSSITKVDGEYAFYNDQNLTSVSLPNATEITGQYCFANCRYMTSLNVPLVTKITGNYTFSSVAIAYITTDTYFTLTAPLLEEIGSYVFNYCRIKSATFPNVTSLGAGAFTHSPIETISIPLVTAIPASCFIECYNLTRVDDDMLPNVTSLGTSAFQDCTSLTYFKLSNVAGSLGTTFSGCTLLSYVDLPNVTGLGTSVFSSCTSLTSISLPKTTTIAQYCFNGCTALTTIRTPLVRTISANAFKNCSSLTDLYLNEYNGVATLSATSAFSGTSGVNVHVYSGKKSSYESSTNWASAISTYGVVITES